MGAYRPALAATPRWGEVGFLLLYIGAGGALSSTAVAPVDP